MTPGVIFWKFPSLLIAIILIAGCVTNTPANDKNNTQNDNSGDKTQVLNYQGRLSLRISSDPPQSLYASFNLNGDAQTGGLTLSSPLGNSLAQLSWTPQNAVLKANSETKEYPSASALIEQVTGTVIPLSALFDWMAGKDTPALGWEIDLSAMNITTKHHQSNNNENPVQRLVAKRVSPLPSAELRIAIDK
jgi:outer membrane lipoprotein LolB